MTFTEAAIKPSKWGTAMYFLFCIFFSFTGIYALGQSPKGEFLGNGKDSLEEVKKLKESLEIVSSDWISLFPTIDNFKIKIERPKISKEPKIYSQTVSYIYQGDRYEEIKITASRNDLYKDEYKKISKKDYKAPLGFKIIEVGNKKGYSWETNAGENESDKRVTHLVIWISEEKILTIDQFGKGIDLIKLLAKVDFDKLEKVMDSPPVSNK